MLSRRLGALFAQAKESTGIVGLDVVPNARQVLIGLYNQTLSAVQVIPQEAVYRQNVEALTRQRLAVCEEEQEAEQIEARVQCGQVEELIEQAKDELELIPKMAGETLVLLAMKVGTGSPSPLGPSLVEKRPKLDGYSRLPARGTVNFALFSKHATAVTLCLFLSGKQGSPPDLEIALDPNSQRTGDIWHASVENVPLCGMLYAYKVDGPKGWGEGHRFDPSLLLIDPYAPLVDGRRKFGDGSQRMAQMYGTFDFESEPFDWGEAEAKRKPIPEKDVIIYEMNVQHLVQLGVQHLVQLGVNAVQHLVQLGVNAVELLPIFEYDEMEFQRRPNPRDHMEELGVKGDGEAAACHVVTSTSNHLLPLSTLPCHNSSPTGEHVGVLHGQLLCPMSRFASNAGGPVAAAREVKEMVKKLHAVASHVNTWGYSSVNFFAPMSRFASNTGGPVAAAREVKEMVKKLHAMSSHEPLTRFNRLQPLSPSSTGEHVNTWGYSTVNFFAPMSRFASNGGGPVAAAREVKEMVKKLHAEGVEVILDVVYNHTNEADDTFPYTTSFRGIDNKGTVKKLHAAGVNRVHVAGVEVLRDVVYNRTNEADDTFPCTTSFRGIDNKTYYIVQPNSYVQLANYAGCGNTLNCNHPVVMQMILDSLRHWVQVRLRGGAYREYKRGHVGGESESEPTLLFHAHLSTTYGSLDLASALCTDSLPIISSPPSRSLPPSSIRSTTWMGSALDLASVLCRGTEGEPLKGPPHCSSTLFTAAHRSLLLPFAHPSLSLQEYHVDGFRFDLASVPCAEGPMESPSQRLLSFGADGELLNSASSHSGADGELLKVTFESTQKSPCAERADGELLKVTFESTQKSPCAEADGELLKVPPFNRAIAKDEVLSKCKLIAEPWAEWNGKYRDDVRKFIKGDEGMKGPLSCHWLYVMDVTPFLLHPCHASVAPPPLPCHPHHPHAVLPSPSSQWAEWNGKYRDDVRKFIKGDEGHEGPFATRLAGSADMYHVNQRKPYHSINFVIAHDGFTLRDLVSYNVKPYSHPLTPSQRGEWGGGEGRSNDNFSWNCGAEGAKQDEGIIALRNRQMRNFHIALMVSQ
ncbi:unnamed protein product, partial [Closterium sp. NIES-65]